MVCKDKDGNILSEQNKYWKDVFVCVCVCNKLQHITKQRKYLPFITHTQKHCERHII
jgi:hypothetical protein